MTLILLFYNLGMCTFQDAYISGGNEKYVGIAETEDDCVNLVRTKMPSAAGATYEPKSKHCDAEYGNFKFRTYSSTYYRACLFPGISFLYV